MSIGSLWLVTCSTTVRVVECRVNLSPLWLWVALVVWCLSSLVCPWPELRNVRNLLSRCSKTLILLLKL